MPHMSPPSPAASTPKSSGAGKSFGRFQLLKLLGKSARSMVWLVLDPRSQQELMLTLPRSAPADDADLQRWLRGVEQALRLKHPRLAPAAEVGTHDRWPFLAVERRRGITVGEWLEQNGHAAPLDAVVWLQQALEGLAFAHDAGMAHGDLQLHSLLVDEQGGVSVMALATGGDVRAGPGQPPRPAPSATAQDLLRQQRQSAERDVLSAGVLLYRLLAGQSALDEPDSQRVIERMTPHGRDMVRLPWVTPQPVPEALRVIVNRATANQERQRYLSGRTLARALEGWVATEGRDRGGPLALLIDRLRTVGHLPAMPGVGTRVERLALRDGQHTDEISEEILQDMALSFELLRQVNAALVQAAPPGGAAPVLTIRRCVAMLGLNGVKKAASALRRWPGPLDERGAAAMDKAVQLVRLAGLTAQRLRPPGYDPEVVYLVTVLQNLGRLLVRYHFPDEAEQIRQLMLPAPPGPGAEPGKPQPGMTESVASFAVLGVDTDALGLAVIRHWGLGDEVLHMGERIALDRPVLTPDGDADTLRITACAANEAVDAMATPGVPSLKVMALNKVAQRYARVLDVGTKDLQEALQDARSMLQNGGLTVPARERAEVPRAQNPGTPAGAGR